MTGADVENRIADGDIARLLAEVCDHFAECHQVLFRLHKSETPDRVRIGEYETLIRELEQEIQGLINNANS